MCVCFQEELMNNTELVQNYRQQINTINQFNLQLFWNMYNGYFSAQSRQKHTCTHTHIHTHEHTYTHTHTHTHTTTRAQHPHPPTHTHTHTQLWTALPGSSPARFYGQSGHH